MSKDTKNITLGLLGVLFVGLKLTGYIDWSWVYVTLPFWAGFGLILVFLAGVLLGYGLIGIFYLMVLVAEAITNRIRKPKFRRIGR